MRDTLFVDDRDIRAVPGLVVNSIEYFSASEKRGRNETIPGRRGQVGVAKPLDAYSFSAHVTILPVKADGSQPATMEARRGQLISNLRDITRRVQGFKSGGQVVLKRRLTVGDGVYEDTTAAGEFVHSTAVTYMNFITGRTELEFINLDGCWYGTTDIPLGIGDVTVDGEYATRKMTITLPGSGTLNNKTANTSLTVTTACVIDVESYKTSAGLQTLSSKGDVSWFVLVPGLNHITWKPATGVTGAPTILYRPAHF